MEQFDSMGNGEHNETENVSIAGRILNKRGQGKLMFYDLHSDGIKIQVMSSMNHYTVERNQS